MTRLIIDGIDYTSVASGLDRYDILFKENNSKTIIKSISTEIVLKDRGYDLIKNLFFSSCAGFLNEIKAEIQIDLCGKTTFLGKMTAEGAEDCEDKKEATILFKGETQEQSAYQRLSTQYLWENGFMDATEQPIVYYNHQNYNSINILMIRTAFEFVLWPVVLLSKVIAGAIVAICNAINLIPFVDIDCPSFDDVDIIDNLTENIDASFTGNGRWSTSIIAREAIQYQCDQLGLNFVSSILNSPSSQYYNMAIFSLQGGRFGTYKDTTKQERLSVFDYNAPLLTTFEFMDSIKDLFYADYKIIGNTLFFEDNDFFDQFRVLPLTTGKCLNMCYSYDTNESYAYLDAQYTIDAFDQEGAKAFNPNHTNKLEFNSPPIEAQKGAKSIPIPYSPSRFMYDRESALRRSFFDFDVVLDDFKSGQTLSIGINGLFNVGSIKAAKRNNDLILSGSSTEGYKLLILEDGFNRLDAKVVKRPFKTIENVAGRRVFYEYNYPLYLRGDDSLENRLKKWNPRVSKNNLTTKPITLSCDCDNIDYLVNSPNAIYINSTHGKAFPGQIELKIDHKEGKAELILSEIKIKCK